SPLHNKDREKRMSQRVLITAGAAGIGREIARAFAATGARVFTCDVDEKGLEALVNNAGIAGLTLPVDQYPADDWDKVIAVNLTAMFDVCRLAIPALKESKAGVIVNLSSVAGRFGFANRSPYAATKWGVIGLTKTLAIEL